MSNLDLQLGVFAAALSLAFIGSPLMDYFLHGGPRANRKRAAQQFQLRRWWLYLLSLWFAATAAICVPIGESSTTFFDAYPSIFFTVGLIVLLVSIGVAN